MEGENENWRLEEEEDSAAEDLWRQPPAPVVEKVQEVEEAGTARLGESIGRSEAKEIYCRRSWNFLLRISMLARKYFRSKP